MTHPRDVEAEARRYLDAVVAICAEHDMGGPPPSDVYERAVRDLVRWAIRLHASD